MEDTKKTKDTKKDKESPELKEELTDEELSGLSGGAERKFDDGERVCKFISLAPKVIWNDRRTSQETGCQARAS